MARRPRGKEVPALAQQQLVKTSAANELRILQAVVLPLAREYLPNGSQNAQRKHSLLGMTLKKHKQHESVSSASTK